MQKSKQTQGQSSGGQQNLSVFAALLPRNLHPNLIFKPTHYHYHEFSEALYKIHKKECEYPRVIDWAPLQQVGIAHQITRTLTQSIRHNGEVLDVQDFEKLLNIQEPIYHELCLEFLATLQMYIINSIDDVFLDFKLGGSPRNLSLRQLAACLRIFTNEEMGAPWFTTYIMAGATLDEGEVTPEVWARFSSKPYLSGKNPAKAIEDPKYRVLQKLLAHTITLRGQNTEKATKADLWYLLKLKDRERINLPYCVGKFLHSYASGLKPESRLVGGQFITRIAKTFGINFNQRANPYTLVENPQLRVGIDMYRVAGVVRMRSGKYLPYSTDGSSSRVVAPKEGSRGKRPAAIHDSDVSEEEEEEEGHDDDETHEDGGLHSQFSGPPNWQGFMTDFGNMRIEQDRRWQVEADFRDESRYEWGANRYQNDWLIHNQERMAHRVPDFEPTPYHHPPQWGQPGGILPAPTYDRDTALVELQRQHQDHMHAAEYHSQQQTWGSSWSVPPPSNWQQDAMQHWLFGSSPQQQQPPQDPNQDPPQSGSWL